MGAPKPGRRNVLLMLVAAAFFGLWLFSVYNNLTLHCPNIDLFVTSGAIGAITPSGGAGWGWSGFAHESFETATPEQWGLFLPCSLVDSSRQIRTTWIPLWMLPFLGVGYWMVGTLIRMLNSSEGRGLVWKECVVAIWSVSCVFFLHIATLRPSVIFLWLFLAFVVLHVLGIAIIARPLRSYGETLLIAAVAAITTSFSRMLFLAMSGVLSFSALGFMWYVLWAAFVYWLVLAAILCGYRRIQPWLTNMPYMGNCLGCGYDLRGNLSGKCSECGDAIHEDQQRYLSKLKAETP